jgi:hypothetical protein
LNPLFVDGYLRITKRGHSDTFFCPKLARQQFIIITTTTTTTTTIIIIIIIIIMVEET